MPRKKKAEARSEEHCLYSPSLFHSGIYFCISISNSYGQGDLLAPFG